MDVDLFERVSIIPLLCSDCAACRNTLSRVINPDSIGKERARLSRIIVLCLRGLGRQAGVTQEARDQTAFISLALQAISEGIDGSVAAWEKRDYWVKADKFRMEWRWAGPAARKLKDAVLAEDWGTVAATLPEVARRFDKIKVSDQHRLGTPWKGAFDKLTGGAR